MHEEDIAADLAAPMTEDGVSIAAGDVADASFIGILARWEVGAADDETGRCRDMIIALVAIVQNYFARVLPRTQCWPAASHSSS